MNKELENAKLLPSFMDLLKEAINVYKANLWTVIILTVMPVVVELILGAIFVGANAAKLAELIPTMRAAAEAENFNGVLPGMMELFAKILPYLVISWIFGLVIYVAMLYVAKAGQNKISVAEALKMALGKSLNYLFLCVLLCAAFCGLTIALIAIAAAVKGWGIGIMIIGALFMLVLAFWWIFAPFVLVEENLDPVSCITKSKKYTDNTGAMTRIVTLVFWLIVASIVISFLGKDAGDFIRNFVYPLTVTPLTMFYLFNLYRRVKSVAK